ncbi:MAG: HIT family protein [Kiloniellales bacterium]|nr:HIT family protein [Kiloniellales bacterium]
MVSFDLSEVLLMNESRFPWVILVPRRENVTELHDLSENDRRLLMEEISIMSLAIKKSFSPDKVNVATLGNIVRQLHIHVVARYESDAAWPGPIWGHATALAYEPNAIKSQLEALRASLSKVLTP